MVRSWKHLFHPHKLEQLLIWFTNLNNYWYIANPIIHSALTQNVYNYWYGLNPKTPSLTPKLVELLIWFKSENTFFSATNLNIYWYCLILKTSFSPHKLEQLLIWFKSDNAFSTPTKTTDKVWIRKHIFHPHKLVQILICFKPDNAFITPSKRVQLLICLEAKNTFSNTQKSCIEMVRTQKLINSSPPQNFNFTDIVWTGQTFHHRDQWVQIGFPNECFNYLNRTYSPCS